MFVFVIVAFALIIGLSWLAGTFINKRGGPKGKGGRSLSRQEKITAANLSGAFPIRKEDQ